MSQVARKVLGVRRQKTRKTRTRKGWEKRRNDRYLKKKLQKVDNTKTRYIACETLRRVEKKLKKADTTENGLIA